MQNEDDEAPVVRIDPVIQKAFERAAAIGSLLAATSVGSIALMAIFVPPQVSAYLRTHVADAAPAWLVLGLGFTPILFYRCPVCGHNFALASFRYIFYYVNRRHPYTCPKCGERCWMNDYDAKWFWKEQKKRGVDRKDIPRLKHRRDR